jgi:hypothetical protein
MYPGLSPGFTRPSTVPQLVGGIGPYGLRRAGPPGGVRIPFTIIHPAAILAKSAALHLLGL